MAKEKQLKLKFSRHEYKFFFPGYLEGEILEYLNRKADLDEYNLDRDFYTVNSVYFDTPNYMFYKDKFEGLSRRIKVRIRSYDDEFINAERFFFEIKLKEFDRIYKERAVVEREFVDDYLDGNFTPPPNVEDMDFFEKVSHLGDFHALLPFVMVRYKRLSFYDKRKRYEFKREKES